MIRVIAVFVTLGACNTWAENACAGSDAKYYDDGVAFYLSRAKVPYTKTADSVCVEPRYMNQLKAAIEQLEMYFPQIAHRPKDSCEESALVEWGQREGLRYDLRASIDDRNRPAGDLFLIRSFTREEMVENQGKLKQFTAQNHRCKK
jgi:hypothetical protein